MESDVPKLQPITNRKAKTAAEEVGRGGRMRRGFSRGRGNYSNLVYYGAQHNRLASSNYGNGSGGSFRGRLSTRDTEDSCDDKREKDSCDDKRKNIKDMFELPEFKPKETVFDNSYFPPKPRCDSPWPGYRTSPRGFRYQSPGFFHRPPRFIHKPYGFTNQPAELSYQPPDSVHQSFYFAHVPFGHPPPPPDFSPPLPIGKPPEEIPLPPGDTLLSLDDIPLPPGDMPLPSNNIHLPPDDKQVPPDHVLLTPDDKSLQTFEEIFLRWASSPNVEASPPNVEPPDVGPWPPNVEASPANVEAPPAIFEPTDVGSVLPNVKASPPNVEPPDVGSSPPNVEASSANVEAPPPNVVPPDVGSSPPNAEASPPNVEPPDVGSSPSNAEPPDVGSSPANVEASPPNSEPPDVGPSSSNVEASPPNSEPPDVGPSSTNVEASPANVEAPPANVEPPDVGSSLPNVKASQPNIGPPSVAPPPPDVETSPPDVEPSTTLHVRPSPPEVEFLSPAMRPSPIKAHSSLADVELPGADVQRSSWVLPAIPPVALSLHSTEAALNTTGIRPWYRPPTDLQQAEETRAASTSQKSGFEVRTLGNNRIFVKYSPNIPLPQLNIPAEENKQNTASEFSGPRIFVSTNLFGPPAVAESTSSALEGFPGTQTEVSGAPTLGTPHAGFGAVDTLEHPPEMSQDAAPPPNGSLPSSPCAAARGPRVRRDRPLSISCIGSPNMKTPRRRNLSESQNKNDFLLEKIISMDKASILDIINRTGTKYDGALLNAANMKFREEIRERLQHLSSQLKQSKSDNISPDGVIDAMNLPEAFLEEIRRAFKADIFKNEKWPVKGEIIDVEEYGEQPPADADVDVDPDVVILNEPANGTKSLQCPVESPTTKQVDPRPTRSHSSDHINDVPKSKKQQHFSGSKSSDPEPTPEGCDLLKPVIHSFESNVLPFDEAMAEDYKKDSRSRLSKLHYILTVCTGYRNPRKYKFSKKKTFRYRTDLKNRKYDYVLPFLIREIQHVRGNLTQKRMESEDMALESRQTARSQSEEPEATEESEAVKTQPSPTERASVLEQTSTSNGSHTPQHHSPQGLLPTNADLGGSETHHNIEPANLASGNEDETNSWSQRVADSWTKRVADSWTQRVADSWSHRGLESSIKEEANASSPAAHGFTAHNSEAEQPLLAPLSPTHMSMNAVPNDLRPSPAAFDFPRVNINALRQRTAMYEQTSVRLSTINEQLSELDKMRGHLTNIIAGLQQELMEVNLLSLQLRHEKSVILSQSTPMIPTVLSNQMPNYFPPATSVIPNTVPSAASPVETDVPDVSSAAPNAVPKPSRSMQRAVPSASPATPSLLPSAISPRPKAASSTARKRPAAAESLPTAPAAKCKRLSHCNVAVNKSQAADVISTGSFEAVNTTVTQIFRLRHCILAAGEDGKLYTFNKSSLKLEAKFAKHAEAITKVFTFPGERTFYTASLDGYLKKTAEVALGEDLQALYIKEPLTALDIGCDVAFIGTADGHVYTHQTQTEPLSVSLLCSLAAPITSLRAARENACRVVIISAKTNVMQINDATTGALVRTITVPVSYHIHNFHLDKVWLFCSTQRDKTYKIDWTSGVTMANWKTGRGISTMCCYKNKFLLEGCCDGLIYVFNKETGHEIERLKGPGKMISALRIAGNKVMVAARNQQMQVIELPAHVIAAAKAH